MDFFLLALLIAGTNSVSCFNLSVDNAEFLYPNEVQDEFTTKCFPDVGCFYTGRPWYHPLYRPISVPPADNIEIGYYLYTQKNPKEFYDFQPNIWNVLSSPYRIGKPVTVIVHGYEKNYTAQTAIKDELVAYKDINVVLIDWSNAANFPYYQAVANARFVAAKIAQMLNFLREEYGLKAADIHLIGKSLGGQLVSYIGQRIKGLGRITGLDPGGPYFHNVHKKVRLDASDAIFVDVIHSNQGTSIYRGEGYFGPIGHADFFPNGGNHQPGCGFHQYIELRITVDKYKVANECSHDGSQKYFASSVRKCNYNATACSSYQGYKNGICNKQQTNRMGLFATKPPRDHMKYYLDTASSPPYCEVNK